MSEDYRKLVDVLRSAVAEPEDGGEATRQRILRDLAAPRRPRRARLVLTLLAAGLALSSAWALYRASPPQQTPVRGAVHETAVDREAAALDVAREHEMPAAQASGPAQASGAAPLAVRSRPAKPVEGDARATGGARRSADHGHAAADAGAEAALSEARSPSLPKLDEAQQRALYMTAHRLQFRGAPQRALAAWDAYLASAPTGALVREAQYNRAVILVRLGRRADAERALAPFARGEHGGFRQAEALLLLRSLARDPPTADGMITD